MAGALPYCDAFAGGQALSARAEVVQAIPDPENDGVGPVGQGKVRAR
jgi:hypothetical protein